MPIPEPNLTRSCLCVSDLHLWAPTEPAFLTLAPLLRQAAAAGTNILLLGDLCEVWVGDDDDGPLAMALRELLTTLSETAFVGLMHGNRDFLLGDDLARQTGIRLLPDPYLLGDHVLLSHGDRYCTDDVQYQAVRTMLRSAQWQASVLAQTLVQRRALAADMRRQSTLANANKAENIMDVNPEAVAQEMLINGRRLLIHGHTHRPARHIQPPRDEYPAFERIVLGDWAHTAWVAELQPGISAGEQSIATLSNGVSLRCLPLRR